MLTTTLIAIAAAVLGIVVLALVFLKPVQHYRAGLIVGALALLAGSIAIYLSAAGSGSRNTALEPGGVNTPTQQEGQPQTAPISPVSPLAAPAAAITPIRDPNLALEGCLLFASDRNGDFEIYMMRKSTNNWQRLTDSPGLDIQPVWSPDGSQVAFASDREGETGFKIYAMNADGSDPRRLGGDQPGDSSGPRWSPDGDLIVFQSKVDTGSADDNYDIYVMNADGSEVRAVTSDVADDTEPTWSPDGRQIAFLSERSGQDEIYVMDPDGSNVQQLTELQVLKSGLNWSADSRRIIFEGSGDIYAIDVETKEAITLVSDANSNEATPVWAQQDQSIIFSSDRGQNWELYLLSPGGSGSSTLYQLTDDPGVDRSPDWFPCGQ